MLTTIILSLVVGVTIGEVYGILLSFFCFPVCPGLCVIASPFRGLPNRVSKRELMIIPTLRERGGV
jgi:hypothetical protein